MFAGHLSTRQSSWVVFGSYCINTKRVNTFSDCGGLMFEGPSVYTGLHHCGYNYTYDARACTNAAAVFARQTTSPILASFCQRE
jgi:hypothetical protein